MYRPTNPPLGESRALITMWADNYLTKYPSRIGHADWVRDELWHYNWIKRNWDWWRTQRARDKYNDQGVYLGRCDWKSIPKKPANW